MLYGGKANKLSPIIIKIARVIFSNVEKFYLSTLRILILNVNPIN